MKSLKIVKELSFLKELPHKINLVSVSKTEIGIFGQVDFWKNSRLNAKIS